MRSEEEMFDLILSVAKKDSNIRAVYMNGSRANPNVPKDIFQDYDICYVVTDTKPYVEDEKWIDCFGERLMLQMPDKMDALRTYSDGQVDNIWEATLTMCGLFEEVAIEVADQMGYTYNQNEAASSRVFLEHVRNLPKDASEIF